MFSNNNTTGNWSQIIREEYTADKGYRMPSEKINWMSKYAQNHEMYEALQTSAAPDAGIYSTPLNTLGMGNPMMPIGVGFNATGNGQGIGNTGSDFHAFDYKVGSGDVPSSTLSIALEVAAMTIGLELVPVIPMNNPWTMLQYMDFPYAGGKLMRLNETLFDGKGEGVENKPIYIKVSAALSELKTVYDDESVVPGAKIAIGGSEGPYLLGIYKGKSRIDNGMIIKVAGVGEASDSTTYLTDKSIADVFQNTDLSIYIDGTALTITTTNAEGEAVTSNITLSVAHPDVIATYADHIQEFSNFFGDGMGHESREPMTRAQNETGVGNTIGARLFTKMVQARSYEVTGTVTRQQLQDLPLYGIDVASQLLTVMQNEISQAINNRILDRLFKLGVTNAYIQKQIQGVDLNLYLDSEDDTTKDLSDFSAAPFFVGIDDKNAADNWGSIPNAVHSNSAENVYTHQRRIMSRILAAANLVAQVSRYGRPNWIVTNNQILSAIQDCSQFTWAPMANTLTQDSQGSIYFAGTVAGLNVYVDPYMPWDDTRVLVGRKSNGATPGVVFMPYILADKVQTIAEGTMSYKWLLNSRFAIVDAGFHPEQNYFCFMIEADNGLII